MNKHILALALLLAGPVAAAPKAPDVVETSFVTPDGQSDLQQSVVISAPVAAIDMRVGGTLEASYDPKHPLGDPDNIKHRVITFLPERLIVFQNIQAPHDLPDADKFQRTVIIVQFEPLGPSRTRVTLSCTGFGADDASKRIYAFFHQDNAEELERWKRVYEAPAG